MSDPSHAQNQGHDDHRSRTRQNVIVLAALIALLILGWWLYGALRSYLRLEACIETGRRDCATIDIKSEP
jgi:hypothetical protein